MPRASPPARRCWSTAVFRSIGRERHLPTALVIGACQRGLADGEQIDMLLREVQQAPFQLRLRLDPAIRVNMGKLGVALHERTAHQDGAMAVERLLLGTHQRDALGVRLVDQRVDRLLERRRRGDASIADLAILPAMRVLRPRAQGIAEEPVFDPRILQRCGQSLLVEMRIAARERCRAHVGYALDPGALQQIDEAPGGMVGVTDGPDHAQSSMTLPDWPLSMISNPVL